MASHAKPPSSPRTMSQAAAVKLGRSSSRMSSASRGSSDEEQTKTAVKVAIRVRPPLEPGQPGYELIPQRFQRSIVQVISNSSLTVESPQGRRNFIFDRVFNEHVGQEGVFEWVKESIEMFVTGYNVSLLAYGQSGAGKSYTMGTSGPSEQNDPWQMGVIPRAARGLFTKLSTEYGEKQSGHGGRTASGSGIRPPSRLSMQLSPTPTGVKPKLHKIAPANKEWSLRATYVEIYNDELRDLLLPPELQHAERLPITIREDKGHILLTGLREVVVNDVEDLLAALNYGSSIRQTDATAINARSSRSHAVFSLSLVQQKRKSIGSAGGKKENRRWTISGAEGVNGEQGDEATVTISSKLHFVDLAGSERLKNTGAQGERAKEGIAINAGLAALGKVIAQLSARSGTSGHISYRDSKLTRILSDSLGGNAITYMIACVTPAEFHRSETLNTVQYAQRARAIQSRPQISEVLDEAELRAVVDRLKAEVASLREQLRLAGKHSDPDRPENRTAIEQELQEQLLDLQESYGGLSSRHARLMAELSRERGIEPSEITIADDDDPNSPMNRIKRSNSFAEAVEMVILEYEKTIQSLENTLAEIRASLAQTESTLLEKESKLAYAESINQQLHARISKLSERESSNSEYIRKLETRIDENEAQIGASQEDLELVAELRVENQRLREHEHSSEAYLAVMEENLAEADADIEFWKREVDRLSKIVERQRGLAKLDTLLDELDEVQKDPTDADRSESVEQSDVTADSHIEKDHSKETTPETQTPVIVKPTEEEKLAAAVEDNFLRAELANLRKSHETTVSKLEDLTNTYNSSLECIAELKEQLEDSMHRTSSMHASTVTTEPGSPEVKETPPATDPYLADAGVRTLKTAALAEALLAAGPQRSFSRSRSSEQSLAGVSESYKSATGATNGVHDESEEDTELLNDEIRDLRLKVEGLQELRREHAKLTENYNESLDLLDELKAQLQRPPPSPVQPVSPIRPGLIRSRSVSDLKLVQMNDRASRALDTMSAKVADLSGHDDDLKQSLQSSLSIITTELISKSSQCQQQASEITSLRADVDGKARLISGLTKAQSRTADPAYISALENQLAERETEHNQIVDRLNSREANLIAKVNDLSKQLELQSHELEKQKAYQNEYRKLLNDILVEKKRHSHMSQSSVDSYPASTTMTVATKTELISDYGEHETLDRELALADSEDEEDQDHSLVIAELKSRLKDDSRLSIIDTVEHSRVVKDLRHELEGVRSAYQEDATELQKTLNDVKTQLLSFTRVRSSSESSGSDTTAPEKETTILRVQNLQRQIAQQREDHKEVIATLENAQALAMSREEKVKDLNATLDKLRGDYDSQSSTIINLTTEISSLRASNEQYRKELEEAKQNAADLESIANEAARLLESVTAERDYHQSDVKKLQSKLEEVTKHHNASVKELKVANDETVQNLKYDNSEYLTIIQHLKDQVSESETAISTHLLQLTSVQQKLEASMKDSDKLKKAKTNADRDMRELRNEINVLTKQKQEVKDKLLEVSDILTQLQRDYEGLKSRKASADTEALVLDQAELIKALEARLNELEARPSSADPSKRVRSGSISGRWSNTTPTPPPAMPLPPLPGSLPVPPSPTSTTFAGRTTPTSRIPRASSQDHMRPGSRDAHRSPTEAELQLMRQVEEKDAKIADLERQFRQERQLVQTLEEALSDTEKSMKQLKKQTNTLAADKEILHTKMLDVTHQLEMATKEAMKNRESMHQLSEAKEQRAKAELARRQLEERMEEIASRRKSKFSCF